MTGSRSRLDLRLAVAALTCALGLTVGAVAQQAPSGATTTPPAPPMPSAPESDELVSKVVLRGETLANGTYRLSFRYEPGRGVRDSLGEGSIDHLSFLVYSEPSRSLLALFLCGGDEAAAQQRGASLNALTTYGLPWDGSLEATSYLPHLPESDKTISVELLALGRRATLPGTEELSAGSFATTLSFREMSLLESGEPED